MRSMLSTRLAAALLVALLSTGAAWPAVGQDATPPPATPAAASTLAMPTDAELAGAAAVAPATAPDALPPEVDVDAIEARLAEVYAGLPEADWTIAGLAEAMAFDPAQPFRFVRDQVGFQPYAGVLRGAEGTLAGRAGNSWDRALLLRALLDAMLIPSRLAWGDLDAAVAASLAARGLELPPTPLDPVRAARVAALDLAAVGERARRDYAVVRAALGDRTAALTGDETPQAEAEVVRHAWVQALIGTEWVDLDPSLVTAEPGEALTSALATGTTAPADQRQTLTVRVLVEHLDPTTGTLTERTVLDQAIDVADSLGRYTTLGFKPRSDQLGATIDTLFSGVAEWVPVLANGDDTYEGSGFAAGGSGTDVFGTDVDAPELAAIRMELVSSGPARDPVTAVSPILDRVPPARRAAGTMTPEELLPLPGDVTGAAAVARVHHLMLSVGGFNAHDHVGEVGAGIAYVNDVLLEPELAAGQSLDDMLRPMLAIDGALVAGAETVTLPAVRDAGRIGAFAAAPRVYVATFGPSDREGEILFRFDLALDDVRLLADPAVPPGEVALRRIWYGALQSAVDTELGLARARSDDPSAVTLQGATLRSGGELRVLDAAGAAGQADLPLALTRELAAGHLAVVPADGAVPDVWWSVAPDGLTRSRSAPGHSNVSYSSRPAGSNYGGVRHRPRVPPSNRGGSGSGTTWGNKGGKTVQLGSSCRTGGGSEYTTVVSCVSVPGGIAFRLVLATAIDAVIFAVIWGAFAAVEASAGN